MSTFDQLNEFIRHAGGATTSVPGTWPLRYDIVPSQAEKLTALLHDAGWRPQPRGVATQLAYDGFRDALVYEISRPKER